jgi:CDP-glucose 4,6-dehydratase
MKYLITGHTGFKGVWLSLMLKELGHSVYGFSLPAEPNSLFASSHTQEYLDGHIILDIRDRKQLVEAMKGVEPDIIIHLAAQSLVLESYKKPIETYETNVFGTLNLLIAAEEVGSSKALLGVTTDKVYKPKMGSIPHNEDDALSGQDPYSTSKVMADQLLQSWSSNYGRRLNSNQTIGIARAGNVIGGGDHNKNRLVPDLVNSITRNEHIQLRYPNAVRPWQHVLDCLSGYLKLTEKLSEGEFGEAWNFGPNLEDVKTVEDFTKEFYTNFGIEKKWDKAEVNEKENSYLALDSSKAKSKLDWQPKLNFAESVSLTATWHKKVTQGKDPRVATIEDIHSYLNLG